MLSLNQFDQINLTLKDGKIISYLDVQTGTILKGLPQRLTVSKLNKIYILMEEGQFLYVGVSNQSLTTRLRQGLNANGKNGYHGYKWKERETITLFVWVFEGLSKLQVEHIEAELTYLIRTYTGTWPLFQNEIHFNNEFEFGRIYAGEIFKSIKNDFEDSGNSWVREAFAKQPEQWGLRGDPYLWKALQAALEKEAPPKSKHSFESHLFAHFKRIAGHDLRAGENYYIKEFAFGGMSSGMISCDFWINKAFPLLISQFQLTHK